MYHLESSWPNLQRLSCISKIAHYLAVNPGATHSEIRDLAQIVKILSVANSDEIERNRNRVEKALIISANKK